MRIKSINWNEKEVEKIKIILIILTILLILEFVKVNLDILETYINLFKKKEYKTTFEKITFLIVFPSKYYKGLGVVQINLS